MSASDVELHRPMQRPDREQMPPAADDDVPVVDSDALFAGHAELRIDHHGTVYRLKRTALGKLILTK